MPTPEPYVDTQTVADFLGKPLSWLHHNSASLSIPRYKVGNHWRYKLSEIEEWVQNQPGRRPYQHDR